MKRWFLPLPLVFLLTANLFPQMKNSSALDSLAESERAFAKTSVEKGIRDSFIEFFAPDGINFQPHPTNTREAFSKRPAARSPYTLNWNPIYADISQAGDLGYTTGPYTLTDNKEQKLAGQGFFFSVWKKQADGTWKVVVDCGIQTPEAVPLDSPFKAAASPQYKMRKTELDSEREALLKADRDFLALAESAGAGKAYLSAINDETRLYRNSHLPITGKEAIQKFLGEKVIILQGAPIKADIAASADLGYTYGSYELKETNSTAVTKGYYVRTWKRDAQGKWKIALDVATVLPQQ